MPEFQTWIINEKEEYSGGSEQKLFPWLKSQGIGDVSVNESNL